MRLISARMAWHDCYYTPWDSVMHHGLEGAKLGKRGYVANETRPDRWENLGKCAHMALAGKVQSAIARMPTAYQNLGNHLYAPVIDTPTSNNWEEGAAFFLGGVVDLELVRTEQGRRCVERTPEWFVARGVLYRYRCMVQGGMGANPDPLEEPRLFRGWLAEHYGLTLDRRNWTRNWGGFIQLAFRILGKHDGLALRPVSMVIQQEFLGDVA